MPPFYKRNEECDLFKRLRPCDQEGLRSTGQPPLLAWSDSHLRTVQVIGTPRLDFHEPEGVTTANDNVDLASAPPPIATDHIPPLAGQQGRDVVFGFDTAGQGRTAIVRSTDGAH
jgi:hypothetical protein